MKRHLVYAISFILTVASSSLLRADSAGSKFLEGLATDTKVTPSGSKVIVPIFMSPPGQRADVRLSYQGDQIAYIKYPQHVGDSAEVVVLPMGNKAKAKVVWHGKELKSHFSPMLIKWAPLGNKLAVEFGYLHLGDGECSLTTWVLFDLKSGKMIGPSGFRVGK